MKKTIYIVSLILMTSGFTFGQFSAATYQFGSVLPQSSLLNPSVITDYKVEVGLPALSSIFTSESTSFTLSELGTLDGTSFTIDLNKIPSKIKNGFNADVVADIQLFHLGLKVRDGYLSVDLRQRTESRVSIPKELFEWVIWGPADPRVSNSINFDNLSAQSINYLEFSGAYARTVIPGLQVGVRLKYLSGQGGISGSQRGSLHVSADSVSVQLNDFRYSIGGIPDLDNVLFDASLLLGSNSGFGIDLGATYEVKPNLTLSASVTDLGFISWKNDVSTYGADDINYSFTGFDFADIISDDPDTDVLQAELDEFTDMLNAEEKEPESFKTGLSPKVNASISYKVKEFYTVGATIHSVWYKGGMDPSISVHQTLSGGKVVHFLTGITFRNGKISNLSTGLVLKPGPVQFYIISDRINTFFSPSKANALNLRVGMNLVFGKRTVLTE